nr:hypothetical protein [Candidatus Sigynarchaeota archaeon]
YRQNTLARKLLSIIEMAHELLNDDLFKTEWESLLKEKGPEGIPNPLKEWIQIKLCVAIQDQVIGHACKKILEMIISMNEMEASSVPRVANPTIVTDIEISNRCMLPLAEVQSALDFLMMKVHLLEPYTMGWQDESGVQSRYKLASSIKNEWIAEVLQK